MPLTVVVLSVLKEDAPQYLHTHLASAGQNRHSHNIHSSINNGRPELPYGRKCHEVTSNSTETYILCPSILDNPHPPYTDIAPDEPISAYIRPKTNHTAYSEKSGGADIYEVSTNTCRPFITSKPVFRCFSKQESSMYSPASRSSIQSGQIRAKASKRSFRFFRCVFSPDLPLYECQIKS